MIKKYNSYIFEKYQSSLMLLLEGTLYSTTDFTKRLKSLANTGGKVGDIADMIIDLMNNRSNIDDKFIRQNFFDVTDKEDSISFLPNNRIDKDWDQHNSPELPYVKSGRNEIRIGRIIKYFNLLYNWSNKDNIAVSDKDIEEFVNFYKSTKVDNDKVFKLIDGEDIKKYYNKSQYASTSGQLGNSCMANSDSKYFNLYAVNPNIKMLIYVDSGDKIHGRALVWTLDKSPCDSKVFMDRIYTTMDSDIIKFKSYANTNNWFYKKMNSYSQEEAVIFTYKGNDVLGEIEVNLLENRYNHFPFLDTLMFFNYNFTLAANISFKDCLLAGSSSGSLPISCDNCNGAVEIYCDYCTGNTEVNCLQCNGSGKDTKRCRNCDIKLTEYELQLLKQHGLTTGSLSPRRISDLETGDICVGLLGDEHGINKFYVYKSENEVFAIQKYADGSKAPNKGEWVEHGHFSWVLASRDDCRKLHIYQEGTDELTINNCHECGNKEIDCEICNGDGKYNCKLCSNNKFALCEVCAGGHRKLGESGIPTKYNKLKDKYS